MKRLIIIALLAGLLCPALYAADEAKDPAEKFKSPQEAFSYAIGIQFGTSLKDAPFDMDMDAIMRGVKDAMADKPAITQEEAQTIQRDFFANWQKQKGSANIKEGAAFLETNEKAEGVKATKSGLQYKVVKKGDGPKPGKTDTVTVHYKGTTLDGNVFDSSYKRGEPATFQLDRVIPGWTEGLQLMPVGSKYTFWIPSELAYGERGAGGDIGPNAVLKFEVELLEIK